MYVRPGSETAPVAPVPAVPLVPALPPVADDPPCGPFMPPSGGGAAEPASHAASRRSPRALTQNRAFIVVPSLAHIIPPDSVVTRVLRGNVSRGTAQQHLL